MGEPDSRPEGGEPVVPPREVLKKARSAANAGEYAEALVHYETFFDRALLDQGEKENFYGVRLSYCLNEWASLGVEYPPAMARLEAKAEAALAGFEATCDAGKFHDYKSINECLKRQDIVLAKFMEYHRSNSALAKSVVHYMWDRLVDGKLWELCAAYLTEPEAKYGDALDRFDLSMEVCRANPSFGGEEYANLIKDWYVRDVGNLLLVLKNTGRGSVAARIQAAIASDMRARNCPSLIDRINGHVSA